MSINQEQKDIRKLKLRGFWWPYRRSTAAPLVPYVLSHLRHRLKRRVLILGEEYGVYTLFTNQMVDMQYGREWLEELIVGYSRLRIDFEKYAVLHREEFIQHCTEWFPNHAEVWTDGYASEVRRVQRELDAVEQKLLGMYNEAISRECDK